MTDGAHQPAVKKVDAAGGASAPAVDNNFNLLRLVFALMVVAYHATILPALKPPEPLEHILTMGAEVGVQGFFVLSGYLVYSSLVRTRSLGRYAEKRFRRLYPGYATVVILCAAAALALSPEARAAPGEVARYLGWNLGFLNFMSPSLPGVFAGNPLTEINGALWTLKIEVMFYLLLPVLAWLLRATGAFRWVLIVLIYVGAEAWRIGLRIAGHGDAATAAEQLYPQLPGQMSFFITGIAFAMLGLRGVKLRVVGIVGLGLFVVSLILPQAEAGRALGLGALSIWLATGIPRLFDAARFGDLSYGLYIVHFPIIQTVIALGLFRDSPAVGLGVSAISALIAALALWHLVEKPALRSDSAYKHHG